MYDQDEFWNGLDPKRVVQEGYDRIAERHAEWTQTVRVQERSHYTAVLIKELSAGSRVLDLGCGSGVPTTLELARHFDVTGVDISAAQLELARQNVPKAQFIEADMTRLNLPAESFDAITAFYSFFHIPRQEQPKLLHDIATWLRPGGLYVGAMGTRSVERNFDKDFLGTLMYSSSFDTSTNIGLIEHSGLQIVSAQVETAVEFVAPVPFLWVIARRPE